MGAPETPTNFNKGLAGYRRDCHELTNWSYCYLKDYDLMAATIKTHIAFRRAKRERLL